MDKGFIVFDPAKMSREEFDKLMSLLEKLVAEQLLNENFPRDR